MNKVTLNIYKINKHSIVPEFATDGSACFDVYSSLAYGDKITAYREFMNEKTFIDVREDDSVVINPGMRVMVPTGIIFDIPDGYSVRLHPRSGLALKNGIVLVNQEAVIDSDYVQETFVLIENISKIQFEITHGMRICQGELVQNIPTHIEEIGVPPQVKTRTGGFGSTGLR